MFAPATAPLLGWFRADATAGDTHVWFVSLSTRWRIQRSATLRPRLPSKEINVHTPPPNSAPDLDAADEDYRRGHRSARRPGPLRRPGPVRPARSREPAGGFAAHLPGPAPVPGARAGRTAGRQRGRSRPP